MPFFENARKLSYKGKYEVELEVPRDSGLTDVDIARILRIASWQDDVNKSAIRYEGTRSIIIGRAEKAKYRNLTSTALQVSGVGYLPLEKSIKGVRVYDKNARMLPPSKENFMKNFLSDDTLMGTTDVQNGQFITTKPTYRALGSYLESELKQKIQNTVKAEGLGLKMISVPHAEAAGRYLDLGNEDGHLCFSVFAVPELYWLRFWDDFDFRLRKFLKRDNPQIGETIEWYAGNMSEAFHHLCRGLRELHDAGYVHRQPHSANFYYRKGRPVCLADWSTLRELNGTKEEQAQLKAIDLEAVFRQYDRLYSIFVENKEVLALFESTRQNFMDAFLGGYADRKIDSMSVYDQYCKKTDEELGDVEFFVGWLLDNGDSK